VGSQDAKIEDVRASVERSRFHAWMGMRLEHLGDGEADIALEVRPEHLNLMDGLHGGVITSLADSATGVAMHAALEQGWTHTTTSIHVTFLRSEEHTSELQSPAMISKRGRRFGYAEADVERSDGTLLARAAASFLVQEER